MKKFCSQSVPMWTLILAVLATLISMGFWWATHTETQSIKSAIRAQEEKIPGFVGAASILSPEATCRRNLLIQLKDKLIDSDSCSSSF